MTARPNTVSEELWEIVDVERKKDRKMKWISTAAWSVTGVVLLGYGAIIVSQFLQFRRMADSGMFPPGQTWTALVPLIAVVGVISFFVAVLATIGMFVRMRTASLSEIQIRLAALEDLVVEQVGRD